MTLQAKLMQIGIGLAELTDYVYHYWRPVTHAPCIIWAEDGEDSSFDADNQKVEQRITGTVDCFTRQEFDPLLDSIQTELARQGMTWSLSSVQYEDETNLIHYQWRWGVVQYGATEI